ncbi:DUF1735 domain-containing protein [Chitinophaga sp. SYP-B3965]|uniref:discoidin domain-containing protein n=1 Tax=Chitinophaga sp. SYP-B3965 TaxID=2663120 RepID=UPI0012999F53|nr:discoidin domain-containing protein [Chitinophaga sp. SYP-B3965]MRG44394.1 DUF1735 domain-containing protein [Chitinophaga sp. SYP-B3965]
MMNKNTILLCWMLVILASCSKDNDKVVIPAGSISFARLQVSDTILLNLPVENDSVAIVNINAIANAPIAGDHNVTFAVDNEKLTEYKAKYGEALLLPANSWHFYQPSCNIGGPASEINIVQGTKLKSLTTYVLPIVIQSVDGIEGDAAKDQTLFIVVKTGRSSVISKAGWKIQSVSSEDLFNPARNLLDDDVNSLWSTEDGIPQHVVLDLDGTIDFSAVTYRTPAPFYTQQGGYVKQLKIEISMDGLNWEDKGTYGGQTSDAKQVVATGNCTARYLKFTILSIEPFFGAYNIALIGDIGLMP